MHIIASKMKVNAVFNLFLVALVAGGLLLATRERSEQQIIRGYSTSYYLQLTADNAPMSLDTVSFGDGSGQVRYVGLDYTSAKRQAGAHVVLSPGGLLQNAASSQITSMQNLVVNFSGDGLTLYTGITPTAMNPFATLVSGETVYFSNNPYYFSLLNTGSTDVTIASATIEYSCVPSYSTVTFVTNGGSEVLPITQAIGTTFNEPSEPYKEGNTFTGWYSDVSLLEPYSFPSTIPSENLTLYVGWSANTYAVTYYEILHDINYLATGEFHSLATTAAGKVFAWGQNTYAQLGDNTKTNKDTPTEITWRFGLASGEQVTALALGQTHSMALTTQGRIFTWGDYSNGRLGDGSASEQKVPNDISYKFSLAAGDELIAIAAGVNHSMALSLLGRVFTWGYNGSGQIGNNTNADVWTPTEITSSFGLASGDKITTLNAGLNHSSAISLTGRIFTWGDNAYGQLGNNAVIDSWVPVEITANFGLASGESIFHLTAGSNHMLAITSNFRAFAWGQNTSGQLGIYSLVNQLLPVEMTSYFSLQPGDYVTLMMGGYNHSVAVTADQRIYAWGGNEHGQLGDNTLTDSDIPTEITSRFVFAGDEQIDWIALGNYHSTIMTTKGNVNTWGYNAFGQLGDATKVEKRVPVEIGFNNYAQLATVNYSYGTMVATYLPERSGYTFNGWYFDTKGNSPYTYGPMPAYSLMLYGEFI